MISLMFIKALLALLLVSATVAAPAPAAGDAAPPIITLHSNVTCTSVVAPSSTPGPSSTVIHLNIPSASPSGNYGNNAAEVQSFGAPPVIKLNKRQFGPSFTTNPISVLPSSLPLSLPTSVNVGSGIAPPSSSPSPTALPNSAAPDGPATFTNAGADGKQTVFVLSTITVTGPCSTSSTLPSSTPTPGFLPSPFSQTPSFPLSSTLSSSSPAVSSPPPSVTDSKAQGPVEVPPPSLATSSLSAINLNPPSVLPTTTSNGFTFSSVSTPSITSALFPVDAAVTTTCGLGCLLTATV